MSKSKEGILRVEHKHFKKKEVPFFISPYFSLKVFDANSCKEFSKLRELILKSEPTTLCRYRNKKQYMTIGPQHKEKDLRKQISIPTTWILKNPGLFEDPFLRDVVIENHTKEIPSLLMCGFRELNDVYSWFEDEELRKLLKELGFHIKKYKSEKIHHGLRQSVAEINVSQHLYQTDISFEIE